MNNYGYSFNVAHNFDLTGLKVGDHFLGCIPCQKMYAVNAVGVPRCGNCLGPLNQYTVTEQDKEIIHHSVEESA